MTFQIPTYSTAVAKYAGTTFSLLISVTGKTLHRLPAFYAIQMAQVGTVILALVLPSTKTSKTKLSTRTLPTRA
jgi:hypothetical protein